MSTFDKKTKGDIYFAQRDKELDKLIDSTTGKVYAHLVKKINCMLCESPDYTVLFTKNGFDFVRCNKCGHIYVNPQLSEESITAHYNDNSKTTKLCQNYLSSKKSMELRSKLYKDFFSKLKEGIPGGNILDIGCSMGQFLKMGKDLGYEVLGLELNEEAAQRAKKKFGVPVERKLLEECSFDDNSFDIISMFGVIEHLPNPVEVIKDVYRILKPGGAFIGLCPNVNSLVCMVLHQSSRTFDGRMHLSYFSNQTIRYLFTKVGFQNKNIEIGTCYTGKDSLLNYFQFLDPFGDEEVKYLPDKFRKFITDKKGWKKFEKKMSELNLGLKLTFIAKKKNCRQISK
ncbi:class I SAM-dependent methyltransferase [Patescibacteria group bacterium]|nr:class I SAM-dependent methyltransferase [Patescibacteria group bacterium]